MSTLSDKLRSSKDFFGRAPASEEAIQAAEETLHIKFSDEYKAYISELGAATIHGHELTGVCSNKLVNVVDMTLKAREQNSSIRSDLYVVEDPHIDSRLIWQDVKGAVYLSKPGAEIQKAADSLTEYLKL